MRNATKAIIDKLDLRMPSINCLQAGDLPLSNEGSAVRHGQADVVHWMRSERCENGACVEVKFTGDVIAIRSSTDPETMITFGPGAWRDFIVKIKSGAFGFA